MVPSTESWRSFRTVGTAAALALATIESGQSIESEVVIKPVPVEPFSVTHTTGSLASSVIFDRPDLSILGRFFGGTNYVASESIDENDRASMPIRQLKRVGKIKVRVREIRKFKFPSLEA